MKAIVGVACFTRYTELIHHGNIRYHGIYYFVPGLLQHFDTEAIYSLVAPRPMLMLSGDQDGGAPTDGVATLERKLGAVYDLYGKKAEFRSVVYKDTGHEYLPEMKEEMTAWFQRYFPPGRAAPKVAADAAGGTAWERWLDRRPEVADPQRMLQAFVERRLAPLPLPGSRSGWENRRRGCARKS